MNFKTWSYLFRYSMAKPGALSQYRSSLQNQFLSKEHLVDIVWKKTRKLVDNAYQNVPWYKSKLDAKNISPDRIHTETQFREIPILTREELANNFQEFISNKIDAGDLKISTTGGSTGHPLKIGMDPKTVREVPKWQMLSWWGLSPLDNMASIYRGLPEKGIKKAAWNFIRWPQKILHMDATNITPDNIELFLSEYSSIKPRLVHGYVGGIEAIAEYIIDNNIEIQSPKVVWTTAAPISKIQEEKISEAFKAPVCDQYGCSELYFIAAECPQKNGLHIFSDSVKVEILDDNNDPVPNGKYGKIVISNLNEYSFPLIRYENGDRGRLLKQKCSCGLSLPLMDKVKGRMSDNIELPDDTILSGEYLTTIFDDYTDTVKQFQIVQHKRGDITVKVVPYKGSKTISNVVKSVEMELQKRIQNQVDLNFKIVDHVQQKRGKIQFIISE
ncbi:phenylacetate--CoA ligase family protein [Rhodohalobacter sulfatireducens]|uniref:Phenylacetate--CoA ligase family protein n=1 Tax=Rhodohalobacter sulfatireducens TaxID=2911366 RepID=A0ABS9KIX0_9BACT|nr:hypothetical protein [Rhodohalobacter sulfatireducens]MCG2590794.1 hypothetical protein [Rhodohalobacter sulfatireducens]